MNFTYWSQQMFLISVWKKIRQPLSESSGLVMDWVLDVAFLHFCQFCCLYWQFLNVERTKIFCTTLNNLTKNEEKLCCTCIQPIDFWFQNLEFRDPVHLWSWSNNGNTAVPRLTWIPITWFLITWCFILVKKNSYNVILLT